MPIWVVIRNSNSKVVKNELNDVRVLEFEFHFTHFALKWKIWPMHSAGNQVFCGNKGYNKCKKSHKIGTKCET